MNTAKPKSEDPVDLIAEPEIFVAGNGYRWVPGESGVSKPKPALFLVANPGGLTTVTPPNDFYLKLAHLDINEESTLVFAAKFGPLGLRGTHFHRLGCPEKKGERAERERGESSHDWISAIETFQSCYEVWEAQVELQASTQNKLRAVQEKISPSSKQYRAAVEAEQRNLKALEKMVNVGWLQPQYREDKELCLQVDKDLSKAARTYVMNNINFNLSPRIIPPSIGCFRESCDLNKIWMPPYSQFAVYKLRTVDTKGKSSIKGHLVPSSLLMSAWLQFAELVCGQRKLRQCDVCRQWMDVTDQARPGAKRMHDRCSLNERMRRYLSKRQK